MKIKKAIRRIDEAQQLLSDVIDRYAEVRPEQKTSLETARKQLLDVKAAWQDSADRNGAPLPGQPAGRSIRRRSTRRRT